MQQVSVASTQGLARDIASRRSDFPILAERVYDKPLVFLDSAASAQKPQCVIDAIKHCYSHEYANIHRGVYWLSARATEAYEQARSKVQRFINAASAREIVFTKSTTEAINLVAYSYGGSQLKADDEVILSELEHHANIVPWQLLRDRIGIRIKVVPIDDRGNFLLDEYVKLLGPQTRLVALTHTSNALGTITQAEEIIRLAHSHGAHVLLDGAQYVVHGPLDVQALDVDFYTFSGHKLYGPSGIGVLYGKADILSVMPPYQGGGDMIRQVTFEKTEFADIPGRFEAGTPHIAGAYGLSAAIDYLTEIGMNKVAAKERELLDYATERLGEIDLLRLIGAADKKAGIISFEVDGVHAHDVGTILDREGIAVRVGHHCAQPLMDRFGITGTVRASFGLYNDKTDVDALVKSLGKVQDIFG
ncbi:MAG: cysteine desulfurase CsdA [Woeseia sp.]|nr:cysteine desulfurase CsdA [Woeseia sp.]